MSLALEESNRARSELLLRESEALLRESEERFSTAFRVSPLNITILRLSDARFVEANDAFVRWFGLDRDRIIGRDSRELNLDRGILGIDMCIITVEAFRENARD